MSTLSRVCDGGGGAWRQSETDPSCGAGGNTDDCRSACAGVAATGGGATLTGGAGGDVASGSGALPRSLRVARAHGGDNSHGHARGARSILRGRRRNGLRVDFLGNTGGGGGGSNPGGAVAQVQGDEPIPAQYSSAAGVGDVATSSRCVAAGNQSAALPLKTRDPGRRRRIRGCWAGEELQRSLEPPPWPGDRGVVPPHLHQGRTWRGLGCVLVKLRGILQLWMVLCDTAQMDVLKRFILLLDKHRGELLRIAWIQASD
ncbi:WAG22 antigen-like [Hordeum vulgare subsp. vulgare]|uniref:WAG22 antigen-like n=1 Tax=Hordeum vulgare subsp. vulgare TaxID=112509 RepID=UPI001D1A48F6|nr:WAG22 antigen-like [Hordeum vulgare subsp. vulgare]